MSIGSFWETECCLETWPHMTSYDHPQWIAEGVRICIEPHTLRYAPLGALKECCKSLQNFSSRISRRGRSAAFSYGQQVSSALNDRMTLRHPFVKTPNCWNTWDDLKLPTAVPLTSIFQPAEDYHDASLNICAHKAKGMARGNLVHSSREIGVLPRLSYRLLARTLYVVRQERLWKLAIQQMLQDNVASFLFKTGSWSKHSSENMWLELIGYICSISVRMGHDKLLKGQAPALGWLAHGRK